VFHKDTRILCVPRSGCQDAAAEKRERSMKFCPRFQRKKSANVESPPFICDTGHVLLPRADAPKDYICQIVASSLGCNAIASIVLVVALAAFIRYDDGWLKEEE
jgi:hypothetical protein